MRGVLNGRRRYRLSLCSQVFPGGWVLRSKLVIRKEASQPRLLSVAGTIAQTRNADRAGNCRVRSCCLEQNVRYGLNLQMFQCWLASMDQWRRQGAPIRRRLAGINGKVLCLSCLVCFYGGNEEGRQKLAQLSGRRSPLPVVRGYHRCSRTTAAASASRSQKANGKGTNFCIFFGRGERAKARGRQMGWEYSKSQR